MLDLVLSARSGDLYVVCIDLLDFWQILFLEYSNYRLPADIAREDNIS